MDVIEDISRTIVEASTRLSKDKLNALKRAIEIETNDNASWCLSQILENYEVAGKNLKTLIWLIYLVLSTV